MKSIRFNTEMVKATNEDRKTNTRRPIKKVSLMPSSKDKYWFPCNEVKGMIEIEDLINKKYGDEMFCPYGKVGDRLWVKEKFCIGEVAAGDCYPEATPQEYIEQCADAKTAIPYEWALREGLLDGEDEDAPTRWKSSIHMKREQSRITLEITDIRVERVQEIVKNWDDIRKEGIKNFVGNMDMAFKNLWNTIYGKDAWDRNDWVWVITFKVVG